MARAGNDILAEILASLQSLLRVWIGKVLSHHDGKRSAFVAEHARVLDAVRAGDRAAAEAAMREHLETGGRRLTEALGYD